MESDYILDALIVITAVVLFMTVAGVTGWVLEELLPRIFKRFKKHMNKLAEQKGKHYES